MSSPPFGTKTKSVKIPEKILHNLVEKSASLEKCTSVIFCLPISVNLWKTFLLTGITICVSVAITELSDFALFHSPLGKTLGKLFAYILQKSAKPMIYTIHRLWKTVH